MSARDLVAVRFCVLREFDEIGLGVLNDVSPKTVLKGFRLLLGSSSPPASPPFLVKVWIRGLHLPVS